MGTYSPVPVVHFWVTISKTVRPMLSDRCLSVLSVKLVYCGQMVGWIKMKLGMQVGLGLGHIVLDGTQLLSPNSGRAPQFWMGTQEAHPQFSAHVYCG